MMRKVLVFSLCFLLAFLPVAARADWLDEWFNQYVDTGPDYFEGQKRGYVTAGSFSARWSTGSSYPISIATPYFNVGCGGIDAFLGGMSFAMLPEYLVQKFQALVAAAPAIAFQVALSVLSHQLSDKLDAVENIINLLNSVQLDECRIQKGVVVAAKELAEGRSLSEAWTAFSQETGLSDLYTQAARSIKNKPVDRQKVEQMVQGCPADLKAIALEDSLVEWALQKSGSSYASSLASYVRAFLGDVVGRDGKFVYVEPCPQVETEGGIDALLEGKRWKRNVDGTCVLDTSPIQIGGKSYDSVLQWAQDSIQEVADSLRTRQPLSDSAKAFLATIPAPIYKTVETGILMGNYQANAAFYARLAATAAVYRILRTIQGTGLYAMVMAHRVAHSQSTTKEDCKPEVLESFMTAAQTFLQKANIAVTDVKQTYANELEEVTSNLQYALHVRDIAKQLIEALTQAAKGGAAS